MMRLILILAALLPAAGCSSWLLGSDNRPPPAELAKIDNPIPIARLWKARVGSGTDGAFVKLIPAVADGQVYAASFDGTVTALGADDGAVRWEVEIDLPISAGVGLSDDLVLVGTPEGQVIALRRENGKQVWAAQMPSEVLAAPRAAEGMVVVRTVDGNLVGLDAATGERRWSYHYTVPVLTLRGAAPPLLAQGVVICGLDTGRVLVLSLQEGIPLFEKTIVPPRGRTELERMVDIDAEPKVVGNVLFVATYQGNVSALDLRNGDTLWTRDLSSHAGLEADAGRVYVSDAGDTVWALDWRNGDPLWKQEGLSNRNLSAPVVSDDYLVVGDFEGYLHWLARDSGRMVGRVEVDDDGIGVPPAVAGDTLYVLGNGGTLSALRVDTRTAGL